MTHAFQDHFAHAAAEYATFRPHYPDALFQFLVDAAPARELAWDAATGNGQAAVGLARHFARVVATDASTAQIAHAVLHPRVEYRVGPAEASGLPAASADLITVAQALHWLDRPAFYAEARRVLAASGVLAVWTYGLVSVTPEVDRVVRLYYSETLAGCWPPDRRLVDEEYRTVDFPFVELRVPAFTMEASFSLTELGGYLRTWSGTRRYVERHGRDPVDQVIVQLASHWSDPTERRIARWRLHLRAGRVR